MYYMKGLVPKFMYIIMIYFKACKPHTQGCLTRKALCYMANCISFGANPGGAAGVLEQRMDL